MALLVKKLAKSIAPNLRKLNGNSNVKNKIKVLIRVRPLNKDERKQNHKVCVNIPKNNKLIDIQHENKTHQFGLDDIANMHATQEQIFQMMGEPVTDYCLAGYNGIVFTYGQTKSIKNRVELNEDKSGKIFKIKNQQSSRSHLEFTLHIEFIDNTNTDGITRIRTSPFNIIDLAGVKLKQAGAINKYLNQINLIKTQNNDEYLKLKIDADKANNQVQLLTQELNTIKEANNKYIDVINGLNHSIHCLNNVSKKKSKKKTKKNKKKRKLNEVYSPIDMETSEPPKKKTKQYCPKCTKSYVIDKWYKKHIKKCKSKKNSDDVDA